MSLNEQTCHGELRFTKYRLMTQNAIKMSRMKAIVFHWTDSAYDEVRLREGQGRMCVCVWVCVCGGQRYERPPSHVPGKGQACRE